MVATKKTKIQRNPWNWRHIIENTRYQNPANMNITELGLKILEKTAKKAY